MHSKLRLAALTMGVAMAIVPTASLAQSATEEASGDVVKLGFITKFPVDFFFTLENAAKDWDAAHPEAEVLFAQGQSATDDAGVTAAIEDLVTQGVQGIAITPTSDAVIPALDAAVAAGVKVVLMDNDLPSWTGKTSVVATDNLNGGILAGEWLATVLQPGDTLAILEGVPGVAALDARVDGMLQGLGDLAAEHRDRQATADRLRTGPGPDRDRGHPDEQSGCDCDLCGVRSSSHRCHHGDRQCRTLARGHHPRRVRRAAR